MTTAEARNRNSEASVSLATITNVGYTPVLYRLLCRYPEGYLQAL
jgi:hypothetical protein